MNEESITSELRVGKSVWNEPANQSSEGNRCGCSHHGGDVPIMQQGGLPSGGGTLACPCRAMRTAISQQGNLHSLLHRRSGFRCHIRT